MDLSLAFMHVIGFDVSGVCVFSDLSSSLHGPEFLCFVLVSIVFYSGFSRVDLSGPDRNRSLSSPKRFDWRLALRKASFLTFSGRFMLPQVALLATFNVSGSRLSDLKLRVDWFALFTIGGFNYHSCFGNLIAMGGRNLGFFAILMLEIFCFIALSLILVVLLICFPNIGCVSGKIRFLPAFVSGEIYVSAGLWSFNVLYPCFMNQILSVWKKKIKVQIWNHYKHNALLVVFTQDSHLASLGMMLTA